MPAPAIHQKDRRQYEGGAQRREPGKEERRRKVDQAVHAGQLQPIEGRAVAGRIHEVALKLHTHGETMPRASASHP
jgi:hypothetical protein